MPFAARERGDAEVVRPLAGEARPISRRTGNDATEEATPPPRTPGSVWTTVLALAGVLGLIVVVGRLWKKHGPPGRTLLPTEALELLGRRPIDARQNLYLVRLGSRMLVLGSSAEGLTTLAEITDPVEVDYLAGVCRPRESGEARVGEGFLALFNRRQLEGGTESQRRPGQPVTPARPAQGHAAGRSREAFRG
ncbi:MAG: flagellar biosynthetic protein FliO [Planctomycetes bacterium]|nr:flagellar biosynthetic protein FliO [Planctomycetota bacterium]